MRKQYIIIIAALIICITSCESNQENNTSGKCSFGDEYVYQVLDKAEKYLFKNEVDSAITILLIALNNVDSTNNILRAHINILLGSSYFQGHYFQEAISQINRGINFYEKNNSNQLFLDNNWTDGILLLVNCYRILNIYDSAFINLNKIHKALISNFNYEITNDNYYLFANMYTWKSYVYSDIGEIDRAISNSISAIEILEKYDTSNCVVSNNYTQLGHAFQSIEDYLKAEQYYIKAAQIITNCFGDSSLYYGEKVTDLGNLYYEAGRYNKSLHCFEISKNILEKKGSNNDIIMAASYNNLADVYCRLGDFSKGINHYLLASEIFKNYNLADKVCIVLHNLGNAYNDNNNLEKAEKYYIESLKLATAIRPNNNIYTAFTYQRLGQLYLKRKKFKIASEYYSKAIDEIYLLDGDSIYLDSLFLKGGVLSETILLESLYYKGHCEFYNYIEQNNQNDLIGSVKCFNQALQLLDLLRNQYNSEKSKLSLNQLKSPLIKDLIVALLCLKSTKQNCSVDNNIFQAIERNKYTALRSLIYSSKTDYISYLPPEIAVNIDSLYKRRRYYENRLSNYKAQNGKRSQNLHIEKLLFNTTFILDTLISHLKNRYPRFKKDQCLFSYYSIKDIQELIPDSVGVLEYFYNDSVLVVFAINKETYHIHYTTHGVEFEEEFTELTNSIQFSNSQLFIEKGQLLFNALIKPIYPIIESVKSLVIIPDRHFNNLPFEVLNNPQNSFSNCVQQQDYLIKNFDITYQFSINLWGDKFVRKNKNNIWNFEFSGHAPFAYGKSINNSEDFDNLALPSSGVEINSISNFFSQGGGSSISYFRENSTKKSIENSLKVSRIVHIATHGYTDCSPDNYSILLQPITPEQVFDFDILNLLMDSITSTGFLTLSEIYNLDINSDLVSLSTCCSGTGNNYIGEGTKSLALGFYYSGANNILYTTWNVSDMHTYCFMKIFYKYVCNGISYSRALRKTKLDFLQTNNQLPIFWSGYLLNGLL